jgi:hypothetical protein
MEVIEKFDGQSVFFTWDSKTGDIRAAYSEAEIKKGGLDPDSWLARWKDHPAEGAFVGGFRAIQRGVKSIDTETLTQIFGEDARNFVMSEIMFPANPNLINYDGSYIVMHNLRTYDESGKEIDAQLKGGQFGQLVDAVEAAEKEVDAEGWKMVGPQITKLKDLSSGKVGEMYASKLDSITGMSDDSTIADYVEEKLRAGVIGDLPIPVVKQEGIIKLILGKESAPSLRDLKAGLGKDVQKKVSALATKTNSRKTILSMTKPIERVISDFAIEILDGLASVFIENHSDEIDRLKSELEAAEQKIRSAQGSEDLIPVLTAQMEKLGDVSNITSSLEGIVFEHPPGSKQLYKLTGAFAMLNQIIGRAMRIKETDQNEALVREYLKYTLPIYVG